jgi:hypothetical protein
MKVACTETSTSQDDGSNTVRSSGDYVRNWTLAMESKSLDLPQQAFEVSPKRPTCVNAYLHNKGVRHWPHAIACSFQISYCKVLCLGDGCLAPATGPRSGYLVSLKLPPPAAPFNLLAFQQTHDPTSYDPSSPPKWGACSHPPFRNHTAPPNLNIILPAPFSASISLYPGHPCPVPAQHAGGSSLHHRWPQQTTF